MPVGAFCAFLGFWRLVRYFTLFLGHAEIYSENLETGVIKDYPGTMEALGKSIASIVIMSELELGRRLKSKH